MAGFDVPAFSTFERLVLPSCFAGDTERREGFDHPEIEDSALRTGFPRCSFEPLLEFTNLLFQGVHSIWRLSHPFPSRPFLQESQYGFEC